MISTIIAYKSNLKILKLFSLAPGKMLTRKEIKGFTRLSNMPLDMAIKRLINENILIEKKRLLMLNLSDEKTKVIIDLIKKEQELIREIPYSIWSMLFDFIISLEKTKFKKAFLFGSYAKHIAREDSDIDIALIIEKRRKEQEFLVEDIAGKIKEKYKKNIQLHYFEEKDFEEGKGTLLKEIREEGIRIF